MKNVAIKYDKVFNVSSKVIKKQPSVGKLTTLLIRKHDSKLPHSRWEKYSSYEEVQKHFPPGSTNNFAKNYFQFKSKTGETTDLLHVMTWDTNDVKPSLVGGKTPDLAELKKLNGKAKFTINKVSHDLQIDLSNKNSHTEIATVIETALKTKNNVNGFKDASVTWSTVTQSFIVTAGANSESIFYVSSPDDGTDISSKLGLSEAEGARITEPLPKLKDLSEVLNTLSKYNDTYYVVTLDYELTNISELDTIGDWVKRSDFDYLFLYTTTDSKVLTQYNYLEKYHKYTGLMVEYFPTLAPAGFTAGMLSSMNLNKQNANINLAFNDASYFKDLAITDDSQLENLKKNKVNSIYKFGRTAEPHTWYYDGVMFGEVASPNVYLGHSFIKFNMQQMCANFFSSNTFIGLYDDVKHRSLMILLNTVFEKAKSTGLITGVNKLTDQEKVDVDTIFKDKSNSAIQGLETQGYYLTLDGVDEKTNCLNVTLAYMANFPTNRLCINAFIFRAS